MCLKVSKIIYSFKDGGGTDTELGLLEPCWLLELWMQVTAAQKLHNLAGMSVSVISFKKALFKASLEPGSYVGPQDSNSSDLFGLLVSLRKSQLAWHQLTHKLHQDEQLPAPLLLVFGFFGMPRICYEQHAWTSERSQQTLGQLGAHLPRNSHMKTKTTTTKFYCCSFDSVHLPYSSTSQKECHRSQIMEENLPECYLAGGCIWGPELMSPGQVLLDWWLLPTQTPKLHRLITLAQVLVSAEPLLPLSLEPKGTTPSVNQTEPDG